MSETHDLLCPECGATVSVCEHLRAVPAKADLRIVVDEHAIMESALREIERWPAPIDGSKVRAIASAALGRLSHV